MRGRAWMLLDFQLIGAVILPLVAMQAEEIFRVGNVRHLFGFGVTSQLHGGTCIGSGRYSESEGSIFI